MTASRQVFKGYTLLDRVGVGPIGEVYRGVRSEGYQSEQVLAIKRIHPPIAREPTFQRLFHQNVARARRLTHPSFATIMDHGEHEGTLYVVTEFRAGYALNRVLAYRRYLKQPLPPHMVVFLVLQVCDGLQFAHQAKADARTLLPLVHGNIKPSNVHVGFDGLGTLLDLGVGPGCMLEPEGPLLWLSRESLAYLAPEQARGVHDDARVDVYALGALMFEMLTLEPVIERAAPLEMLRQATNPDVSERLHLLKERGIEGELARIVTGALQPKPKSRFPDAKALFDALAAIRVPGFHVSPANWIALVSALRVEGDAVLSTPLEPAVLPYEPEAPLEPWDLCWMETAVVSEAAWRQGMSDDESTPSLPPSAIAESGESVGIMLIDEVTDEDSEISQVHETTPSIIVSHSLSDYPDEGTSSSDDMTTGTDEVKPSAPMEIRMEDLEDTSDIPDESRDEEGELEESTTGSSLMVDQVLEHHEFESLEQALAQLERRGVPSAPSAPEPPGRLVSRPPAASQKRDLLEQTLPELTIEASDEEAAAIALVEEPQEPIQDDFRSTRVADVMLDLAQFALAAAADEAASTVEAVEDEEEGALVATPEEDELAEEVLAAEDEEPSAVETALEAGSADGAELAATKTSGSASGAEDRAAAGVRILGQVVVGKDARGQELSESSLVATPPGRLEARDAPATEEAFEPAVSPLEAPQPMIKPLELAAGEFPPPDEATIVLSPSVFELGENLEDVTDAPDAVTLDEISSEEMAPPVDSLSSEPDRVRPSDSERTLEIPATELSESSAEDKAAKAGSNESRVAATLDREEAPEETQLEALEASTLPSAASVPAEGTRDASAKELSVLDERRSPSSLPSGDSDNIGEMIILDEASQEISLSSPLLKGVVGQEPASQQPASQEPASQEPASQQPASQQPASGADETGLKVSERPVTPTPPAETFPLLESEVSVEFRRAFNDMLPAETWTDEQLIALPPTPTPTSFLRPTPTPTPSVPVEPDGSDDFEEHEITGEIAVDVLGDAGDEEGGSTNASRDDDTLSPEVEDAIGRTSELALLEGADGAELEIETLSSSDLSVADVEMPPKVDLRLEAARVRPTFEPEPIPENADLPVLGLDELEIVEAEDPGVLQEAASPADAGEVSPRRGVHRLSRGRREAASSAEVSGDQTMEPARERPFSLAPPPGGRLILPPGFVLKNRYKVLTLLSELPLKSLYQVQWLEEGRRKCSFCGYGNNLQEDTVCFSCKQPLSPRLLTLSTLLDRRQARRNQRFTRRALRHPNLSPIQDEFEINGTLCRMLEPLTDQLDTGVLLAQLEPPLTDAVIAGIGRQVTKALFFLHESGVNCALIDEYNIYLKGQMAQLFDLDVQEVWMREILPTPLRTKDVVALSRLLLGFVESRDSALGKVLFEGVEGRYQGAHRLGEALSAVSLSPSDVA